MSAVVCLSSLPVSCTSVQLVQLEILYLCCALASDTKVALWSRLSSHHVTTEALSAPHIMMNTAWRARSHDDTATVARATSVQRSRCSTPVTTVSYELQQRRHTGRQQTSAARASRLTAGQNTASMALRRRLSSCLIHSTLHARKQASQNAANNQLREMRADTELQNSSRNTAQTQQHGYHGRSEGAITTQAAGTAEAG